MTISNKAPQILGLAGTHGSGKDTIADLLVAEYGFCHISTSDIVREYAQEKYGSVERPVLYKMANELRNAKGHGVLSQLSLERYEKQKEQFPGGVVISGLRAIAEAEVIQKAGGSIIFVDADKDVRFERMISRGREKEATLTREDFQQREDAENGGVDPAFNIIAIKDIADVVIENNGNDIEDFKTRALNQLGL